MSNIKDYVAAVGGAAAGKVALRAVMKFPLVALAVGGAYLVYRKLHGGSSRVALPASPKPAPRRAEPKRAAATKRKPSRKAKKRAKAAAAAGAAS